MAGVKAAFLCFSLCLPVLADLATGLQALRNGDYAAALNEFLPLAKQGNAEAQDNLGRMYAGGRGVPQDDKEAVMWWRLAAAQGNADAESNLGFMYSDARGGVPQDGAEAARWYRLAADQGLADAQFALGLMYTVGLGVPPDNREAARWYRLAADQGIARAQSSLGFMYSEGRGVPRDYVQAHLWFSLAADAGDADGIDARPAIEKLMKPDQIAEARRLAREWKQKKNP